MVDKGYSPNNYKTLKISSGAIRKSLEILRYCS